MPESLEERGWADAFAEEPVGTGLECVENHGVVLEGGEDDDRELLR
nr:hypothetical protein [Curtobacterium sp. PhB131]